jgi:AmmeMemoRadiSam system protein A
MSDRPHGPEHAIEIHLPFLQVALKPGFRLVPVIVGQVNVHDARLIADAIRPHLAAGDLVIASSDFTHYGANFGYFPFRDDIPANLKKLDMGAFEKIEKLDAAALAEYKKQTDISVCGHNPIMVLLHLLPDSTKVKLLNYDTSGAQTGDYSSSVSYVAAAFTGEGWPEDRSARKPAAEKAPAPAPAGMPEVELVGGPTVLTPQEQQMALKLARAVVETYVRTGKTIGPGDVGITPTPTMLDDYGVFVTLHKDWELRGCIGNIWPTQRLVDGIIGRAVDAAVHDRRFTPVSADELKKLDVEISVLTKPRKVDSYDDIVIGKHGMVVHKHGRSAVYLPQVAPEQGWNIEQTLSHLSRKAGLGPDDWREGAWFEVFEAQVFKEKTPGKAGH